MVEDTVAVGADQALDRVADDSEGQVVSRNGIDWQQLNVVAIGLFEEITDAVGCFRRVDGIVAEDDVEPVVERGGANRRRP